MPSTNNNNEDTWQQDFALLLDQIDKIKNQPPPEIGTTPKELIYKENKLQLFRYQPLDVEQNKTPILLVYALVNSPYILDLEPDRSLVLRLLEKGYPVYLIDWGYPDSTDCFTDLNDYIYGLLHRCVQQTKRSSKSKSIDLIGICQGGVFSLCYAARQPNDIRRLITVVTPIDFQSKNNLLSLWSKEMDPNILASNTSNIPSQLMSQLFKTLKPFQLNRDKYRRLKHIVSKKEKLATFLRMEKWLNNGPDLVSTAANEFIQKFYQQNSLQNRCLSIANENVLLENIRCPVLNLYTEQDHIVPPSSAKALGEHIPADLYEEYELQGGHIGAFISPKTQKNLIKKVSNWLK